MNQRHMISKIYFPRLILPCSVMITASVDAALSSVLFVAMMLWHGLAIGWSILVAPLFLIWLIVVALSSGVMFSCLNALYRDIRFVVPFLIQMGMLVSPVIYEFRAVVKSSHWQMIAALNPLVSILEGGRAAVLGGTWPTGPMFAASAFTTFLLLIAARASYRHVEHSIADRI